MSSPRRVASVVALTILEVIRSQDRPLEFIENDDPSITMPRRLGLSDVVRANIWRYSEEVRRGRQITDDEVGDLISLVVRRPDASQIFHEVGQRLAGERKRGRVRARFPRSVRLRLARRRISRTLKELFGVEVGRFEKAEFALSGRELLFVRADASGSACAIVSGLSETLLADYLGGSPGVRHESCQALGAQLCRWTVVDDAPPELAEEDAASESVTVPDSVSQEEEAPT